MRIVLLTSPRRVSLFFVAMAYFVAGTIWHEEAQDFVRLLQRERQWMWLMATISSGALVVLAWAIAENKRRRNGGMEKWSSGWMVLVVAAFAGYFFLMSYPTEVVHYLQFGILAVLFGHVTRRIDISFVLTTCAGMLDEAYQYWWLHRDWGVYYDFNDVLLNIIAAGFGLAVVVELRPGVFSERNNHADPQRAQRAQREEGDMGGLNSPSFFASIASLRDHSFIFALSLVAFFALGVWTGLIALQAADVQDHSLLLLNRMKPFETFWDTWGGTAKAHHIVRAWPGVVLTGLLTVTGVRLVEGLRRT